MAQTGNWPVRPLRIIIPTAPGGSPDTVARTLGNKLTRPHCGELSLIAAPASSRSSVGPAPIIARITN